MDPLSVTLIVAGVVILLASWIYLLIISFKTDFSWGLTTIFLPPISYLYTLFALDKAGGALGLCIVGWFLIWLGLL